MLAVLVDELDAEAVNAAGDLLVQIARLVGLMVVVGVAPVLAGLLLSGRLLLALGPSKRRNQYRMSC